jgi:hypothetical protein
MMRARSPMPGWANDEPTVMSASVLTSAYGVVPSCERERSGRRGIGKRTMVLLPTLSLFTLGPQKAPRRSGVVGNSVSISEPRSTRCVSTQPIGVWALPSYPEQLRLLGAVADEVRGRRGVAHLRRGLEAVIAAAPGLVVLMPKPAER